MRRMRTVALMAAAVVASLAGPTFLLADEVIIKTIDPDKPVKQPAPADAPKTGEPALPGGEKVVAVEAPRAGVSLSKDWAVDGALRRLTLTEQQVADLKPILEEAAKLNQAATDDYSAKSRELGKKTGDLWRAGGRGAASQPEVQAAQQEWMDLSKQYQEQTKARREQLVEKVVPLLTEEQAKKFKEHLEDWSTEPGAMARRTARWTLSSALPGVELTEAQQQQAMEIVTQRQEAARKRWEENQAATRDQLRDLWQKASKGDEEARKQAQELGSKAWGDWREEQKATREALEALLTGEQKQKVVEARTEHATRLAKQSVEWTVRSFERAGLTEPQKQKVAELTQAAVEAMSKVGGDEWRARMDVGQQLRKDIEALLTDEQKEKVRESGYWQYRRGPGGREGGQPQPGRSEQTGQD